MRHFAACDVKGRSRPFSGIDMRANVNIARKERRALTLENFKGVDLSSSPLRVSTQRATFMKNLIPRDGVNRKRYGWRELLTLEGSINGVFSYKEGKNEVLLVHAGTKLHRVSEEGGAWVERELKSGLADRPSQCFYRDGRAYILGFDAYLAYGYFDSGYALKDVSEIAYVPTTTISIDAQGVNDSKIALLDDVNLLTPWRKNTLVGSNNYKATWQLDDAVVKGSIVSVCVDFWYVSGTGGHIYGSLSFSGYPLDYDVLPDEGNRLTYSGTVYDGSGNESNWGIVFDDSARTPSMWVKCDGTVSVDFPTTGPIESAANITVEFRSVAHTSRRLDELVKQCRFGVLFGTDGAEDRLFLSGHPDDRGVDRWSETDDLTYFPEGNAMCVGASDSAITGYARLSDSTLAVFKEALAGYPTIYYRKGAQTVQEDTDGYSRTVSYFPVTAGTVGEGPLSPRAVANLAGEALILSRAGVFGIELSSNVASGERYARERSRAIGERLSATDLSCATCFSHNGRYYLSVGDGTCYVADFRYKTAFEGSSDTGYEWWVWDNVPATSWGEHNGRLLFGTAKGLVCVFEEDDFSDRTYTQVKEGHLLGYAEGNYAVFGEIPVRSGDVLIADDKRYIVKIIDEKNRHLRLFDELGDEIAIKDGFWAGMLEHSAPVVAEWVTPALSFGTTLARKTLLALGVTMDPNALAPIEILTRTRECEQEVRVRNENGLDLGAFDLRDMAFVGRFSASHTLRMNIRNFNFLSLCLRSATSADCAVESVVMEYKINQTNRGYY